MTDTIKKEKVMNNSNHTHSFKEGDLVTLILKHPKNSIMGGKLLKNDRISDKHHTQYFCSGNEYFFVKENKNKVLLQLRDSWGYRETHVWVDKEEIHDPYKLQNSGELKVEKDKVTFQIPLPVTLEYTFEEFEKLFKKRSIQCLMILLKD